MTSAMQTATDRTKACLERVAQRDETVMAFASLDAKRILAEASAVDAAAEAGPLAGMMVAVKDVIHAEGWPTKCNSPICPDTPAEQDAAVVADLRRAGAVIFGKTVTTEFAFTEPGPTTNPLDPARTPGGSSSGSAAAVADGQVDAALTTQTGGSTIRPAAFCGIFGYKPNFGRVSNDGLRLLAPSFDTIGIHAASVHDLARVASVIEHRPRSTATDDEICFVHAVLEGIQDAEPYALEAVGDATAALDAAGLKTRTLVLPDVYDAVSAAHRTVMSYEMAHNFAADMDAHPELLSASIRGFIQTGREQSEQAVAAARGVLANWRADLPALFGDNEVIILPAASAEAHVGLGTTGSASFNRIWTALGTAALTIPYGTGPAGMPLGLQIVDPQPLGDKVFPAAELAANILGSKMAKLVG